MLVVVVADVTEATCNIELEPKSTLCSINVCQQRTGPCWACIVPSVRSDGNDVITIPAPIQIRVNFSLCAHAVRVGLADRTGMRGHNQTGRDGSH